MPRRADAPAPAAVTRFPAGTAEPVRLTHGGRADQGLAYIGWPTTGFYADQRQARSLTALADVFQLRLIQKIREEQGTTYSPGSGHSASETFADYGAFFARIEARPEALAGFLRDAEGIVADLRDRPVEADEMARAMRPRLEGLARQRNDNGWWLNELPGIQRDPRVALSITSQIADYQSLTPADLQRAARQFLLPNRAYKLLIVPREGAAAPAS
jgi:zinc protease